MAEKLPPGPSTSQSEDGRWSLTPRGFLVSNEIISDLLIAQDESEPLKKL